MSISNLSHLKIKLSQDKARLEQLKAQETYLLVKRNKRLQILIGTAILSELNELTSTDDKAYQLKFNQLRQTLTAHTQKQRDKDFLMEFDLLDDTLTF